jgi:hypothetical protein
MRLALSNGHIRACVSNPLAGGQNQIQFLKRGAPSEYVSTWNVQVFKLSEHEYIEINSMQWCSWIWFVGLVSCI